MQSENDVRGVIETKRKQTTIKQLAPEMLTEIFSYLPLPTLCETVAVVCRQWHDIVKQGSLCKVISLNGKVQKDDPKEFVQKTHKFIRVLKMCNYEQRDLYATTLALQWDSLRTLHFDHLNIQHSNIFDITNQCPNLTCLKMNYSKIERDSSDRHRFTGVNKLKHLSLFYADFGNVHAFVRNFAQHPFSQFECFGEELESIAMYCPQLEYINLISNDIYISNQDFKRFLNKYFHTIRHLHMHTDIRDKESQVLIRNCVQLESLTVSNLEESFCLNVDNITAIPTLKYINILLHLTPSKEMDFKHLFKAKNNIKHLAICDAIPIRDVFSYNLLSLFTLACPNLISLHLVRCDVTDEEIEVLCKYATNLETLILIDTIVSRSSLRKLRKLNLKNVSIRNCSVQKRDNPPLNRDLVNEYENNTRRHENYKQESQLICLDLLSSEDIMFKKLYGQYDCGCQVAVDALKMRLENCDDEKPIRKELKVII